MIMEDSCSTSFVLQRTTTIDSSSSQQEVYFKCRSRKDIPMAMYLKRLQDNNPNQTPLKNRLIENNIKNRSIEKKSESRTATAIFKGSNLSYSNLMKINGLNLTGCAVISKGVLVVEGGVKSVKRYRKHVLRRAGENLVTVWLGSVAKPRFGKFTILQSGNDSAVRKFFADHGASRYWDRAVRST